jgi:Tfp pilus assembly protein PilP
MRPALTIIVGFLLAAIAPGLSAQTKPAATPQQKPATQPAKPAAAAPAQQKPAAQNASKPPAAAPQKNAATQMAKPAAKQAPKPAAKPPAAKPPAAKPVKKPATPTRTVSAKKPADATEPAKIARRDPFESLVSRQQSAANAAKNLPPGKAGLQVSTLRVDGIVKATNGMIAVVTNPQSRTYFLREGDRLYDGAVEKISMDGVTFHEEGKDAFGKPVERQVNKRIYSIAGEQQ